jgi:hypothetical protein
VVGSGLERFGAGVGLSIFVVLLRKVGRLSYLRKFKCSLMLPDYIVSSSSACRQRNFPSILNVRLGCTGTTLSSAGTTLHKGADAVTLLGLEKKSSGRK